MADKDLAYLGAEERKGIQRMKINVVDCANFGLYHIQTIKNMEGLLEVDIVMNERAPRREFGRNGRDDIPSLLQMEFGDEMKDDPAWKCPRIKIVGNVTGKVMGSLRGGAWIPGWKPGDPTPSDDTLEAYWVFTSGSTDEVV